MTVADLTDGFINEPQNALNNVFSGEMLRASSPSTSSPFPQVLSRKDSGDKQVCPHAQTTKLVPSCDLTFSFD